MGRKGLDCYILGRDKKNLGESISKYGSVSVIVICKNSLTSPVTASFSRTVLDGVIKLDANSLNNSENGYWVSFPGIKRPDRGVDHPTPSSAEVEERVELYLYSSSGSWWPALGWILPLPLPRNYQLLSGHLLCMLSTNISAIRKPLAKETSPITQIPHSNRPTLLVSVSSNKQTSFTIKHTILRTGGFWTMCIVLQAKGSLY